MIAGVDLWFLGTQPVSGVSHVAAHTLPGRPFTFPVTQWHCHLTGTKLYRSVAEERVCVCMRV